MNYIRHLHAFYHAIKNDESLSALHVTLYLALFQYWNYNRFQNPFSVNRSDLMLLSKIKTKNSYHKCLKELHQKRFIIYHSSNSKFIQAKVSMIKLGLKMPEEEFNQLDLFNQQENQVFPLHAKTQNGEKKEGANGIKNDTGMVSKTVPARYQKQYRNGIKNDTVEAIIVNPSVSKTVPLRYQKQYRYGIKNDTGTVSKTILLIKHKHKLNSTSICYAKTVSEIFEKNKKIQEQISSLKNILSKEKNTTAPPRILPGNPDEKNSSYQGNKIQDPHPEKIRPELKEVESFFLQKNFPPEEAQKFFYYNQSRNWMLNGQTPIRDWQAMAHKWMLLQNEKKSLTTKSNQNAPTTQTKQSANASFLQDAKNDFYASAARG